MYSRLDRHSLGSLDSSTKTTTRIRINFFFFVLAYSEKNIHHGKLYCFLSVCLFLLLLLLLFFTIFLFSATATFSLKPVIIMRTTTT